MDEQDILKYRIKAMEIASHISNDIKSLIKNTNEILDSLGLTDANFVPSTS